MYDSELVRSSLIILLSIIILIKHIFLKKILYKIVK